MKKMKRTAMGNAIRSFGVVLGTLAFGYLSLEHVYKPFLEKAEQYERSLQSLPSPHQQDEQEEVGWECDKNNTEGWEKK